MAVNVNNLIGNRDGRQFNVSAVSEWLDKENFDLDQCLTSGEYLRNPYLHFRLKKKLLVDPLIIFVSIIERSRLFFSQIKYINIMHIITIICFNKKSLLKSW